MNLEHRKIIKNKRDYLIKNVSFDILVPHLKESKMFNKLMWNDLKTTFDVLDMLPSRGPKAFQLFIEALENAGYNEEADALKISESNVPSYEMSTKPLGYCLIINNVDFEVTANNFERRDGSDVDAESLRDFFEIAKFKVSVEKNLPAEKIKSRLKEFSKEDFSVVDSMILVILSYGSKYIVYGTDGQPIEKSNIQDIFNNRSCQTLQNKPKIIFFICCEKSIHNRAPKKCCQESTDGINIMPEVNDIYIFHTTFPKSCSALDPQKGSIFCQVLMPILKENYLKYDLETMMKFFYRKINENFSNIVAHSDNLGDRKRIMLCKNKTAAKFQRDKN